MSVKYFTDFSESVEYVKYPSEVMMEFKEKYPQYKYEIGLDGNVLISRFSLGGWRVDGRFLLFGKYTDGCEALRKHFETMIKALEGGLNNA